MYMSNKRSTLVPNTYIPFRYMVKPPRISSISDRGDMAAITIVLLGKLFIYITYVRTHTHTHIYG